MQEQIDREGLQIHQILLHQLYSNSRSHEVEYKLKYLSFKYETIFN